MATIGYLMKPSLVAMMTWLLRNLNPRERVGVTQFGSLLLHHSPQQHQQLGEADYDGTKLSSEPEHLRTIFYLVISFTSPD